MLGTGLRELISELDQLNLIPVGIKLGRDEPESFVMWWLRLSRPQASKNSHRVLKGRHIKCDDC